jgi:hypothetical protein
MVLVGRHVRVTQALVVACDWQTDGWVWHKGEVWLGACRRVCGVLSQAAGVSVVALVHQVTAMCLQADGWQMNDLKTPDTLQVSRVVCCIL